jgi:MFS family permease
MRLRGARVNSTALPGCRNRIVSTLGLTQILAWGSTYYLPAVIAKTVSEDTGWPLEWVVGGLSLGLLIAGLVSPRVGAAIDRRGGRNILALSAGSICLGLLGLAAASNLFWYVGAWLIVGVGMGAGLYDAAFATLGRLYGQQGRSAITMLTLFGGLASTVCWPLSAFLLDQVGWRGTCVAYAVIQLLIALPLYLLVLPREAPAHFDSPAGNRRSDPNSDRKPHRYLLPVLLAMTLTLAAIISSTLSVHLLNILQATGLTLSAAVALGALIGPSQVVARAIEMAVARFHHPIWTKLASVGFTALGVGALFANLPIIPLALMFYGAGIGLESIARGTLPLALFGSEGYATLMGRLAMPSLIAQAAAPSVGALLIERAGTSAALGALAGTALLNVVLACGLAWLSGIRRVCAA